VRCTYCPYTETCHEGFKLDTSDPRKPYWRKPMESKAE
jgi:hypothetical protein